MIVDTSVWIDVERGRLAPADIASITGNEPIYLAPPVLAELEYGVRRAATPAQRQKRENALARIRRKPCLILDGQTGIVFGRLAADLDAAGTPFAYRVQDVWIAALALQHGMKALTRNRRDFENIPGLDLLVI